MDPKQDNLTADDLQNASSDEIRSDIKGTRRNMDETLDELGERLHPRHLLDDVIDLFRGSPSGSASRNQIARTSKQLGRTVASELKEHPLPALLVGAGLVWWIIDATTDDGDAPTSDPSPSRRALVSSDVRYPQPRTRYASAPGYSSSIADEQDEGPSVADRARNMASSAGDKASGAASAVSDRLSTAAAAVGDTVSGAVSGVGNTISQAASSASDAASDLGDAAWRYSDRGRRAVTRQAGIVQERFRAASHEYPLAIGGAFLAAGLLAGLLLPRTEQEDEWMGQASDELKDQTLRKGQELVEQGKQAASRTADAALDEAQKRGLTPENLAEKAGKVVSAAAQAAKETAEEEGVAPSHLREHAQGVADRAGETVKEESKLVAPEPATNA